MCDDSEPDDYADEDGPHEHEQPEEESAPTPGERLLYALGQLYRIYRHGALNVGPINFDVRDLAGIIGVRSDIEFVSEDKLGAHYHFPDEVLEVAQRPDTDLPWRLLDVWTWAASKNSTRTGRSGGTDQHDRSRRAGHPLRGAPGG